MKSSPWMIFVLFIIHIAGILFLLINSVYSLFNRKTKRQKGNCCKIGSDLAFTLLFLYHTSLIILALFSALLCQFVEDWKEKIAQNNLVDIFIICGGVNYLFVLVYLTPKIISTDSLEIKGKLHVLTFFAFLHFLVFWFSVVLLLACAIKDCSGFAGFSILAEGYAVIPLVVSYLAMALEASFTHVVVMEWNTVASANIISKDDAISLLQQKSEYQPCLEVNLACGHPVCARCGEYVLNNLANETVGNLPVYSKVSAMLKFSIRS